MDSEHLDSGPHVATELDIDGRSVDMDYDMLLNERQSGRNLSILINNTLKAADRQSFMSWQGHIHFRESLANDRVPQRHVSERPNTKPTD